MNPLSMIRRWLLVTGCVAFAAAPLRAAEPKTIVCFGDSLTAGYGVDPDEAFPALLQQKIIAAGLPYRVVNAGLSGETTAGGLRRVDWILRGKADVFVLELGANDALRGLPIREMRENLQGIIDRVRARSPEARIVLAGMEAPRNLGDAYTRAFSDLYRELAASNHLALIPFLLEGVAGRPELNQADGIHPTAAGHAIVAATVWQVLSPLL
jgi:acyl-CoA thioesterase-1